MVDPARRPGGVCLYKGCIPSKTFLFLSELIHDAERAASMGITFDKPRIDLKALREWKGNVIDSLANGLVSLSNRRGVQLMQGRAQFESSNLVRLHDAEVSRIKFRHAIIATGSRPIAFPGTEFKPGSRIMSSTGALALADIPPTLLILGGGYVGLELGTVYAALGSRVSLVELEDHLLLGVDRDLVEPLHRRLENIFETIRLQTKVASMQANDNGVDVILEGDVEKPEQRFDRVLVAIGRKASSQDIGLENTKVELDEKGFIKVDEQQRTTDGRIFAVGDVAGGLMLAHKATREGKVAAEVIAGEPSAFDVRAIPAVVYTDPQIAAPEGLTKIIIDPEAGRILGVGIVGRDTEGLISEGVLAIEMGALAEDMALSIHPHPTLSETEGEAAELFLGSATHILSKKIKT
jgi:dihydrolipoamide dehydrogenase